MINNKIPRRKDAFLNELPKTFYRKNTLSRFCKNKLIQLSTFLRLYKQE